MKDEIVKLCNRVIICQDINKLANAFLNHANTDFTPVQLKMIAELSANESIIANREARHKLAEWETELNESKRIFDERIQPLYTINSEDK